jgi:hypothetical protein
MDMKKLYIMPMAFLIILASSVLAVDWTTEQSYNIGDVVTYNGQDYECIQAHTSQAGWTPTVVPALWKIYESPDTPDDGIWKAGKTYNIGDEVIYNEVTYIVRQTHTSQSDWIPSAVLALYKPKIKTSTVNYLPPESNYEPSDYISMSRNELITMMDFEYVESKQQNTYLEYTWTYLHPQFFNNKIQWLYKPIKIRLDYEEIERCLGSYTENECYDGLVTGNGQISYSTTENNVTTTETVSSVVDNARNNALNSIENAINLQNEITNSLNLTKFETNTLGFTLE